MRVQGSKRKKILTGNLYGVLDMRLQSSFITLLLFSPSLPALLVSRGVAEEKRIVFTCHSSGGSITTLVAIWFLEKCTRQGSVNQAHPFRVTFGAPLIGNNIFNHAVRREGWSQCILHFLLPLDVVPRIPLTSFASFREEIQAVLDWLSPQTPNNSPAGRSLVIPEYYETLLRSTLSIASYEACSFMGCTSSILGTLTSFIDLSPYRLCGTYHFFTSNEQLIVLTNSDADLQLLFYCLQLDPQQQLLDAAARSSSAHWQYEPIKQCMPDIVCVDYLGAISSTAPGTQTDRAAIGSIELSKEAILHLSAAVQWGKQRQKNQTKIDKSCQKIQEALRSLNNYKRTCELRGVSYYDSFKLQREVHDFNANVRRLELAGLWDEIIEMLWRRELPDGFEAREEWVRLGMLFRRLVQPLDIANYYRHSKNEDTGSYLSKGRPRLYKYTQKWHEQLQHAPSGRASSPASGLWSRSSRPRWSTAGRSRTRGTGWSSWKAMHRDGIVLEVWARTCFWGARLSWRGGGRSPSSTSRRPASPNLCLCKGIFTDEVAADVYCRRPQIHGN